MLVVRQKLLWVGAAISFILAGLILIPVLIHNATAVQLVHTLAVVPGDAPDWTNQPSAEVLAAQAQAKRLVATRPNNARTHYLLGLSSLNANDPATAVTAFTNALNLGIDPYVGYQQLGAAHQMAEEPRLAVVAWQASGDLRPALAWGRELLQPGQTETARAVFGAMVEVSNDACYRAEGYCHLSIAWALDGRWDLALVELEQAHRIRPDHPATLVDLARALYYTGGDRVRAEALIARAVELEPESEWIATVLVDMYATVGKPEQAARWIRQLERLRAQTIPRERQ